MVSIMSDCPILDKCIFFNDRMSSKPATVELYKKKYCKSDFKSCARYKVNQATGESHPTLLPNQDNMVADAIKEIRK
jgi:hypothetical protein